MTEGEDVGVDARDQLASAGWDHRHAGSEQGPGTRSKYRIAQLSVMLNLYDRRAQARGSYLLPKAPMRAMAA